MGLLGGVRKYRVQTEEWCSSDVISLSKNNDRETSIEGYSTLQYTRARSLLSFCPSFCTNRNGKDRKTYFSLGEHGVFHDTCTL